MRVGIVVCSSALRLLVACPLILAAGLAATGDPRGDGEELIALCRRYCRSLDQIHGRSMYFGGSIEEARQTLATLEQVERDVLPAVQSVLARFAGDYGTTGTEVSDAFSRAGVQLDDNVGHRFDELCRGVARIHASRAASAEQVLQRVRMDIGNMGYFAPDVRVRKLRDARELLLVGQQLDAANNGINRMLVTIDSEIEALAATPEVAIDAARWGGEVAAFAGPGTVRELAAAALEFLRDHPDWGGDHSRRIEVLRCAVRGEWGAAAADVFGRTVAWRLPVAVAVRDPGLAGRALVRVHELAVVTRHGAAGAPPTPPFEGYQVSRSWLLRAAALR